ncbi:hypothetical protein SCHPADRAFT_940214 [Schizopora paradoxa]|uniref:Uncharacterized protein n=1 Tax=Schizopora paradoxa TaxID=27342 RepID=A0A0H2RPW8_9AGAM|nr:hypothetical protein SCHPADRAFT_940214 [Schizopora paradoxa]
MSAQAMLLISTLFYSASFANAVPIDWKTANVIAQAKNLGCLRFCGPAHKSVDSIALVDTSEMTASDSSSVGANEGVIVVILVAAIAALSYHLYRTYSARRSNPSTY